MRDFHWHLKKEWTLWHCRVLNDLALPSFSPWHHSTFPLLWVTPAFWHQGFTSKSWGSIHTDITQLYTPSLNDFVLILRKHSLSLPQSLCLCVSFCLKCCSSTFPFLANFILIPWMTFHFLTKTHSEQCCPPDTLVSFFIFSLYPCFCFTALIKIYTYLFWAYLNYMILILSIMFILFYGPDT